VNINFIWDSPSNLCSPSWLHLPIPFRNGTSSDADATVWFTPTYASWVGRVIPIHSRSQIRCHRSHALPYTCQLNVKLGTSDGFQVPLVYYSQNSFSLYQISRAVSGYSIKLTDRLAIPEMLITRQIMKHAYSRGFPHPLGAGEHSLINCVGLTG